MKRGFVEFLLLVCLSYLFIVQLIAIWPFTIDDMYITLRYAKNWTSGLGLLWNVQEAPVEGYSNFSFLLLASAALLLKTNPVVVLKAMGGIGLLLTCIFTFLISRVWLARRDSLLACIGLLLYKGQIIWAVSGLETSFFEACICGCVYFAFRGLGYSLFPQDRGKMYSFYFFLAGVCITLGGLTRPETPVFMVVFLVLIAWSARNLRAVMWFVLPIFCLFIPYFLWRWHYYGLLFPNPIYCKAFTNTLLFQLDKNYIQLIWPFLAIALVGVSIDYQKPSKTMKGLFLDVRPFFLCLPSLIYVILLHDADTIVAFDNRLFLSAFALLLPLTIKGMSDSLLMILKHRDGYYFLCLCLVFICFAKLFIPTLSLAQYRQFTINPKAGEQLRKQVLNWLKKEALDTDVVVLGDSGMIPYYSNLNYIDSYCINNKKMGQLPELVRPVFLSTQIDQKRPRFVILTSLVSKGQLIYLTNDLFLKSKFDTENEYELTRIFTTGDRPSLYRYEIFVRK
ncbi:MAG: protein LphB [Legionella sp.]|nr:protein LphB [Legionella sp.]